MTPLDLCQKNGILDSCETSTGDHDPDYFELAERMPSAAQTGPVGWLLDYAKFRYSWVDSMIRSIEDRAASLLKAIVAATGAGWALYTWGRSAGVHLGILSTVVITIGAFAALTSAGFCAAVLIPQGATSPMPESNAFACVCDNSNGADARGRFAAHLAATTNDRESEADIKGKRLKWAYRGTFVTAISLLASLLLLLF